MKRLTLIRHAKSDWSDPTLSDFDRPLNPRGKKAAPLMGQRMKANNVVPDLFFSSPAKRARKTIKLIRSQLEVPADAIHYSAEIFDARMRALITLIKSFPNQHHIALIGHNPALTELAQWLCPEAPTWLPTCAVLSLELDIDHWKKFDKKCAILSYYDYPKKQR